MQNWKKVRTFKQLTKFQKDFGRLDEQGKLEITTQMVLFIALIKETESQMDLDFQPTNKSTNASTSRDEPPLLRKRRGRARKTKVRLV